MASSQSVDRRILDTLQRAGFITKDELEEVVRRAHRALDTVVRIGLLSGETIRTVLTFELGLQYRSDESLERFLERVYGAMAVPETAQTCPK